MNKILLIGLLTSSNLFAQDDPFVSTISLAEHRVLFWNVKNRIEFVGPESYDSLNIHVTDGEFISLGPNTGYIIPTAKDMRSMRIELIGFINGQTESISNSDYKVLKLPNPEIYIANINLNSDLNRFDDKALFGDLRFSANYSYALLSLVGINDCRFTVNKWTINVGKIEIIGTSKLDYEHLFAAVINAKKGTEIIFHSFELKGPDGTIREIELNSAYEKKGKRNDVIERKQWSLEPAEG